MCSILIVCVYRFCKVSMYFFVDLFFLYKINLVLKKKLLINITSQITYNCIMCLSRQSPNSCLDFFP